MWKLGTGRKVDSFDDISMHPSGLKCSYSQGKRSGHSKFLVVIVYCEVSGPMGNEIRILEMDLCWFSLYFL